MTVVPGREQSCTGPCAAMNQVQKTTSAPNVRSGLLIHASLLIEMSGKSKVFYLLFLGRGSRLCWINL